MTDFPPGAIIRNRGRLWRVDGVQGEVLTATSLDGAQADQGRFYIPFEKIQPGQITPPQSAHIASYQSQDLLLAAFRLALIHGAAPLVSLQRSRVIPKDYQMAPVVMALRQPRVRMLIADDVGLGKTIEAGLIVTELLARGLARRLLVICPANLREQWQEALDYFFHLDARIISSRHIREMERELPAGTNPWAHYRALITSIDFAKQPAIKGQILEQPWDIVIVDEAHAAAKPHQSGPDQRVSMDRWQLVEAVAKRARHLLLLTATPHNGYTDSYASLLRMLDVGAVVGPADAPIISKEVARRHVCQRRRSDIRSWFETHPERYPFPERNSEEVIVTPSMYEGQAIAAVEAYSQRVLAQVRPGQRGAVLAHWTMLHLHKRGLSSPAALRASLRNRRAGLERLLAGAEADEEAMPLETARANALDEDTGERVTPEEAGTRMERLGFALSPDALRSEIAELDRMIGLAEKITPARDAKLQKLLDTTLWTRLGAYPKVIVFTRYVDTLNYLAEQIRRAPRYERTAVITVYGEMNDAQRREALRQFERAPLAVLVATDAISEGMNLQHYAAQVIHYELPWNPNRLEQRNGRVDRFGQRKPVVYVRTMVMDETLDAKILKHLVKKAEQIRADYGFSPPYFGDEITVLDLIRQHEVALFGEQLALFEDAAPDAGLEQDPFSGEVLDRIRDESFYGQSDVALPEVEARLAETAATVGSPEQIQQFVLSGLSHFGCPVARTDGTVAAYRITVSDPRLRGPGVPAVIEGATFDPEAALEDPDLTAIDLSHPLVRRLIEQVKAGFFAGGTDSGRVAYAVTPDVEEVTALAHVIARYAYTLGGETTNMELLIPIAAGLDGTAIRWGREARPLLAPALRLTGEQVPLADVQADVAEFLRSPQLETQIASVIEQQRQALQVEYQQFARHTAGEGSISPSIRLETRSSDLLTVTMLYPRV